MAEWREQKLGSLASFEYGSALRAAARTGSGFNVYGSNGVVGHHDTALASGPGIIIGRKGSVGALHWSEDDFWPIDTTYWVKSTTDLDLRWMREALGLAGLKSLDSSTGVPGLNRYDAYERRIPVPPLEEQRRIAEILDTIDETIRVTERGIAKRKRVRRGLASDLLEEGSHRARPNWRSHRLEEVVTSSVDGPFGSALKTEHYVPSPGVRLVRLANLGDGYYNHGDDAFIEEGYAQGLQRHNVRAGDVLVASLGDDRHRPGRACLYPEVFPPGIVKADCFRLRPSRSADSRFLMEILNTREALTQIRRLAQGVTRLRVNLSQLRRITLKIPAPEEQRRIAAILDTFDETIRADEGRLDRLRQIRSGLATDLLSGRVRTVAA